MNETYWRGPAEDEAMQDAHLFAWQATLDTIDTDLTGKRVLDAGCNRGGFLRLLVDQCGIGEGFGYDPASGAIEDARHLAELRPLHFEAATTVPVNWTGFDVAFSYEVLYLLDDLPTHARAVFNALTPGSIYYTVLSVHAGSPLMAKWHADHAEELHLPALYDIDDVVADFHAAGFSAAASRLAVGFVPAIGHGPNDHDRLLDRLDYYHRDKVLLRFAKPAHNRPEPGHR